MKKLYLNLIPDRTAPGDQARKMRYKRREFPNTELPFMEKLVDETMKKEI